MLIINLREWSEFTENLIVTFEGLI